MATENQKDPTPPAPATKPARRRYELTDLLAQCDATAPRSAEEIAWMNMPPVGRERLR